MTTDLHRLGGKGANLVRLTEAGLPVPAYTIIETGEYRAFIAESGLDAVIEQALEQDPARASELIRASFTAARLADEQRQRLTITIAGLGSNPVAVRSSATAEDLPGFSFAGQQDTFLDVEGTEDILRRIVDCWASLWSERAMTYRARNRIDSSQVAIAVVIQEMVDATASGVLFTANPRTGKRDEMVIDATFGLGEALVSGQVIPETFVLGPNGGFDTLAELATQPTLTAGHLQELQQLGQQIADLYGEPMDIEWARIGDTIHILQARPITSLYPLPEPNPHPHPHNEPTVWFSFGAFQGMLDPITPLGQDMLRMTANAPARRIAGVTDWRDNQSIKIAGERLWIRVDGLLRIRATRTLMQRFMGMVEPGTAQIVHELAEEPGLQPTRSTPSPRIAAGIARLFFPALPQFGHANRNPARVHRALTEVADRFLERSG